MPRSVTAETQKLFVVGGQKTQRWATITIGDALERRRATFRCSECKARVRPHRRSPGQDAHFEHFREFDGCSLSGAWIGASRPNPDALPDTA